MARPLRIEFAGAVYHVTSRGNASEDIYRDGNDRRQFLALLAIVLQRHDADTSKLAETARGYWV